jgi:hypothetical protein
MLLLSLHLGSTYQIRGEVDCTAILDATGTPDYSPHSQSLSVSVADI